MFGAGLDSLDFDGVGNLNLKEIVSGLYKEKKTKLGYQYRLGTLPKVF